MGLFNIYNRSKNPEKQLAILALRQYMCTFQKNDYRFILLHTKDIRL